MTEAQIRALEEDAHAVLALAKQGRGMGGVMWLASVIFIWPMGRSWLLRAKIARRLLNREKR